MKRFSVPLTLLLVAAALAQEPAKPDSVPPSPGPGPGEIIIREAAPPKPAAVADPAPVAAAPSPIAVESRDRKSIKRAFFMSLVVPGAGEYYVGAKRYTAGFLAAEGLIWSFALVSKFQGDMWRRDYRGYAAQRADANHSREDDDYYRDVYEYPNSDWYNEDQWRQARDLYPDDLAAQAAYVSDKLYGEADAWRWRTDGDWNRYRELRVRSRNALQRISYAAGSALLNHLLSAVNAARVARRYNKRHAATAGTVGWRLDVDRRPDGGIRVQVAGEF
ncbi:MAG: hypothetical protein MUF78_02860 [Candidatus Edwardsbacteria bacterium]|jgi:hypothetical protein|nr:hypothetical protein [Candidatus Edwardsbacteria bacterium]